jgi:cell division protein FtsL
MTAWGSETRERGDTVVEQRAPNAPHAARRSGSVRRARIVRPATPPLNTAALFTIVVLTIATVGLLYLVQTSQVAGLGYEVSRLERQRTEKALENQQLSYEVARLQALPRVEQEALGQLDMQPLDDYLFLTVPLPASEELPAPPAAATRERSVVERIWDRLTGRAEATHPAPEAAP